MKENIQAIYGTSKKLLVFYLLNFKYIINYK